MHTIQIMKGFSVRNERLTHAGKGPTGKVSPQVSALRPVILKSLMTISVPLRNPWASPTNFLSLQHSVLQTFWTTHMLPCPFFLNFQIILPLSLAHSNQEPCTEGILGNVVSSSDPQRRPQEWIVAVPN